MKRDLTDCDRLGCDLSYSVSKQPAASFLRVYVRFRFIFVEDVPLCYRIERQKYIYLFSVKHNSILLFKLLGTSFGHYTIIGYNDRN
jgi:hypothetical protein